MEDESFPGGADSHDEAARFGADDEVIGAVDDHGTGVLFIGLEEDGTLALRGHFVDLAVVASGDEEVAGFIEGESPNVFGLGVIEDLGGAGWADAKDLAVGRGGGVDAVGGIDGDGLDLQAGEFGEDGGLAVLDAEELGGGGARVAATGVEGAIGAAGHGPEVGDAGVVEFLGGGGERDAAIAAEGEALESGFVVILFGGKDPETGIDSESRGEGGEGQHEGKRAHESFRYLTVRRSDWLPVTT